MREACPAPFILGVKLNSGDYMKEGGLTQLEALEQVRYLTTCGMVDMIEISGGTAEAGSQGTSRLHGTLLSSLILIDDCIEELGLTSASPF